MSRKLSILCFGDSNTHGTPPMRDVWELDRFAADIRWPGVVRRQLGDWADIIEEAQPGRTTVYDDPAAGGDRNGLTALRVALDSHRPLDCVVIMLGTNDLHARHSAGAWIISLNLAQLIQKIRQMPCGPTSDSHPAILVICPPPVIETGFAAQSFVGAEVKAKDMPKHLATVAEKFGVEYLNAGDLISVDSIDGIHFDADSHEVLGLAVAEKLKSILPGLRPH
ncbi:SGNH/GDSL hydrolase family protein [Tropicimonas sp. IMCC34011]|uniref:SGNH/GDSL hydrolase family protein n=1 Tax=Tropicimonas sp. IMCC34011 TaxID=2248759 RepID=UPI000E227310|nr:SGNH/GDSL hydrolase family protein [Tropicimonas sp. IMCC34011]